MPLLPRGAAPRKILTVCGFCATMGVVSERSGGMKFDFTIKDGLLQRYNAPILGCDSLVTVPDGVLAIDKAAFYYIRGIGRVELAESVSTIGEEAFYMCEGMTSIRMPRHLDYLGARAFAHCHQLESIVIPEGVSVIHENTFYKCESLCRVFLPRSLTRIEPGAFYGCGRLLTAIYEGTPIELAGVMGGINHSCMPLCLEYGRNDPSPNDPCDFIVEGDVLTCYRGDCPVVLLPQGIRKIAAGAIDGLSRIDPTLCLILPEGLEEIEEGAVRFEDKLCRLVLPRTIKSIPEGAFTHYVPDQRVIFRGTRAEWAAVADRIHIPGLCVECADDEV